MHHFKVNGEEATLFTSWSEINLEKGIKYLNNVTPMEPGILQTVEFVSIFSTVKSELLIQFPLIALTECREIIMDGLDKEPLDKFKPLPFFVYNNEIYQYAHDPYIKPKKMNGTVDEALAELSRFDADRMANKRIRDLLLEFRNNNFSHLPEIIASLFRVGDENYYQSVKRSEALMELKMSTAYGCISLMKTISANIIDLIAKNN